MTLGSNPRTGREELFVGGGDGSVVRFSQQAQSTARVPTGHARDTSAGIIGSPHLPIPFLSFPVFMVFLIKPCRRRPRDAKRWSHGSHLHYR